MSVCGCMYMFVGMLGLNSGPLKEPWVFLTTEPSPDDTSVLAYVLSALWNWKQLYFSPRPHFCFLFWIGFSFVYSCPWAPYAASLKSNLQQLCLSFLSADITGMQYPTLLENLFLRSWCSESWALILCPTLPSLCLPIPCDFYLLNCFSFII